MLLSDSQFYPDPLRLPFRRLVQQSLKMGVAVWHNIYNSRSKENIARIANAVQVPL